MTTNFNNYLLFLTAAFTICVLPGPDMLFVIGNSLSRGVRGGLIASLGMSGGMLVHTLLVTFGLAAIFKESPATFRFIQVAGGIYLLWIGYKTLKAASSVASVSSCSVASLGQIFNRAVLTNLLNPKVAIFFLAFLPQFVDPTVGQVPLQLFVFGFSFLILGLAVDSIVGVASGSVSEILKRKSGTVKKLNIVSGLIFVALGLRILWTVILRPESA